MNIEHLSLVDFRGFREISIDLDPLGTTIIVGLNGTGKTTILEAIAYLGTQRSFRGSPKEAMIRVGCDRAIARALLRRENTPINVEAELATHGKSHIQVNRKNINSRRDLALLLPVTTFSPGELDLIQGPPSKRREFLDDALEIFNLESATTIAEVEKILRQRAALLRSSGGRLTTEIESTLDVWDDRLSIKGKKLVVDRQDFLCGIEPLVTTTYENLVSVVSQDYSAHSKKPTIRLEYQKSWSGSLREALSSSRLDDLRRGANTIGPHRDDLVIFLDSREARTQASQGEQRCIALALCLAVHLFIGESTRVKPILLLDDVFSELDPQRSQALLEQLPPGQTLISTASPLPNITRESHIVDIQTVVGGESLGKNS